MILAIKITNCKKTKGYEMTDKTFFLEELQGELKRAFKWITQATEDSQIGDFQSATYCMTLALQHWIKCQNIRDRYIPDEDAEQMHWKFFSTKALAMAKKEIENEHNQEIANEQ